MTAVAEAAATSAAQRTFFISISSSGIGGVAEREREEMAARSMRPGGRPLNCFPEAFRGAASYSGAAGLMRAAASNARCVVRWQPGPWFARNRVVRVVRSR
jgi:hypothetical protein